MVVTPDAAVKDAAVMFEVAAMASVDDLAVGMLMTKTAAEVQLGKASFPANTHAEASVGNPRLRIPFCIFKFWTGGSEKMTHWEFTQCRFRYRSAVE